MIKKAITFSMVALMTVSLFAGCGSNQETPTPEAETEEMFDAAYKEEYDKRTQSEPQHFDQWEVEDLKDPKMVLQESVIDMNGESISVIETPISYDINKMLKAFEESDYFSSYAMTNRESYWVQDIKKTSENEQETIRSNGRIEKNIKFIPKSAVLSEKEFSNTVGIYEPIMVAESESIDFTISQHPTLNKNSANRVTIMFNNIDVNKDVQKELETVLTTIMPKEIAHYMLYKKDSDGALVQLWDANKDQKDSYDTDCFDIVTQDDTNWKYTLIRYKEGGRFYIDLIMHYTVDAPLELMRTLPYIENRAENVMNPYLGCHATQYDIRKNFNDYLPEEKKLSDNAVENHSGITRMTKETTEDFEKIFIQWPTFVENGDDDYYSYVEDGLIVNRNSGKLIRRKVDLQTGGHPMKQDELIQLAQNMIPWINFTDITEFHQDENYMVGSATKEFEGQKYNVNLMLVPNVAQPTMFNTVFVQIITADA